MTKSEARVRIFEALEKQKEVSEIYIELRPVSVGRIHYKKLCAEAEKIVGKKGRESRGEFIIRDKNLKIVVKVSKMGFDPSEFIGSEG